MKVAFIGLGIMGSRMASHLAEAGEDLIVYNRSKGPTEPFAEMGVLVAADCEEAIKQADVVISMLSNPKVVSQVMLSNIAKMKRNALWIDCSTVNPTFSLKASKIASENNIRFLDAPVAGSKPQASNKELVFFVGGAESDFQEVEPLLLKMGKKTLRIGETGKGASFKMVVNMMLGQSMAVFAEAILLGQSMGIDKNFLLDAVPGLPVSAPLTKFKAENIRNDEWDEQFPLELMHKDLHLAALTAYENGLPLPLTNLTKELYGKAKKEGMGRLDMSAIYRSLES